MKFRYAFVVVVLVLGSAPLVSADVANALRATTLRMIEQSSSSLPTPESGSQRLFLDSADHALKRMNSSRTVTSVEGGGGGGGTVTADSPLTGDGSSGSHLACATCVTLAGAQTLTNKHLTAPVQVLMSETALGAAQYGTQGLDFSGSYTMGTTIEATVTGLTITGFSFYWPVASSLTLKCTLRAADGTVIQSKDLAVSGIGVKTVTFDTPQSLTVWTKYKLATWEKSGAHGYALNGLAAGTILPAAAFNNSMIFAGLLRGQGYYAAGDADPTTDGAAYYMMQEPVLQ